MTTERSRLERFLVNVARVASGSGLHPLALLQAVESEATRSTSDGQIANAYTIALAPSDAGAIGESIPQLRQAAMEMLDDHRRQYRVDVVGPWSIDFTASSSVAPGSVHVESTFRLPSTGVRKADSRGTQVLTRQRNRALVVEGSGRIPLRHTPFTIGRSTECDLTLLDFAVSRQHAVIEQASNGQLLMRDLGSRNKLVVDGVPQDEVILDPGLRVMLGGTTLWLEEMP